MKQPKKIASAYAEAPAGTRRCGNRKRLKEALLILSFCGVLSAFFLTNFLQLTGVISEYSQQEVPLRKKLSLIEDKFREKIYKRELYIDLYGIALNAMGSKIVGDFDFVKDSHGIIQRTSSKTDINPFLNSMEELKQAAQAGGTPLVYMGLPDKAKHLLLAQSALFAFDGQLSGEIQSELLKRDFDCIDLETAMETDSRAPTFDEFFFKTDVHCTTYGEFWMAQTLAEYLTKQYHLQFFDREQVFDLQQYNRFSYDFLGNTARSAGEFFAGLDQFEIYKPNFDTNLTMQNPSAGQELTGNFDTVMLNGYEQRETINQYMYWVTNYGHFTSPHYRYINHNAPETAPRLLILCDSVFMRGFSYLALGCREITVLDSRYFKGTDYMAAELSAAHYDAIVVLGSSRNFFTSSFRSLMELPDLPAKEMISEADYGQWLGRDGVWLDRYNGEKPAVRGTIEINTAEDMVSLLGWAADFCSEAPFSQLYLKVGDIVLQCEYGIKRDSVVNHFKLDSLLNTGFTVTFPADYLKDGEVGEIAFYGVSADGQYLYEPVTYQLNYSE